MSEMWDNYLIAQALGWNWDFGTILLLWGIELGLFLLVVAICGVINFYFENQ